jgi:hypothetical protein
LPLEEEGEKAGIPLLASMGNQVTLEHLEILEVLLVKFILVAPVPALAGREAYMAAEGAVAVFLEMAIRRKAMAVDLAVKVVQDILVMVDVVKMILRTAFRYHLQMVVLVDIETVVATALLTTPMEVLVEVVVEFTASHTLLVEAVEEDSQAAEEEMV